MAAKIISRAEAKAKGLTRYHTGRPCKRGHVVERQVTNGICIECRKAKDAKWCAANPEKVREKVRLQSARHRRDSPDRIRANRKRWELANPEKVSARKRRYRIKNHDQISASEKAWRDANPEKVRQKNKVYKAANAKRLAPLAIERTKEWRTLNPDKTRENGRKARRTRRARLLGAAGSHTDEQVQALLERQNWKCIVPKCGVSLRDRRELDHKTALARGGSNDITNLQWLCPSCNRKKRDKDLSVWAQEHGISL